MNSQNFYLEFSQNFYLVTHIGLPPVPPPALISTPVSQFSYYYKQLLQPKFSRSAQARSQGGGGGEGKAFFFFFFFNNNNNISLRQYPCARHQKSVSQSGSSHVQFWCVSYHLEICLTGYCSSVTQGPSTFSFKEYQINWSSA